jgi:Na+/H+ antiporter NhaC
MADVSAILAVLLGPNGIFAALIAIILGATVWLRRDARQDERNARRAKDADAYEQSLKDLADAGNARPTGSVSDDPYNRDR